MDATRWSSSCSHLVWGTWRPAMADFIHPHPASCIAMDAVRSHGQRARGHTYKGELGNRSTRAGNTPGTGSVGPRKCYGCGVIRQWIVESSASRPGKSLWTATLQIILHPSPLSLESCKDSPPVIDLTLPISPSHLTTHDHVFHQLRRLRHLRR